MSKINLKTESFISRRNRSKFIEYRGDVKCYQFVRESIVDDKTNSVQELVKAKEYCPSDMFKNYKVSDFAIENIQAAGAVDMLYPCPSYGQVDIDTSVDSIAAHLESLQIDNNTVNNN